MGTAFFLEGWNSEFPSDAGAYKLGYIPNASELSIVSLSETVRFRTGLLASYLPNYRTCKMGVNGLPRLFSSKKRQGSKGWSKQRIRGKLVVDGNQFCHRACKCVPFEFNYTRFYKYVTEIIRKFTDWGIEPYFIFDGVDKPLKLTSEHRMRAVRNCKIPTLAYTVFANALSDKGVIMYVADGEGDSTCAEVAKFLDCPVLSYDSDYFLFDIPRGYIDLEYCFKEKLFDSDSEILEVEVFDRREFVCHNFPRYPDHIFLYPTILGNGIYPSTGHLIDSKMRWRVENADKFIDKSPTIENLHEEVKKNFADVKKYYDCLDPLDPEIIRSSPIPKCQRPVPEWFRMSYRTREIPYMVFDALVNGTQHHGSSALSVRIRQCCYAILGVPEVNEFRSDGQKLRIRRLDGISEQLSLDDITSDANDDRKKRVFFCALRCQPNAIYLDALSEEDRFFTCTVIFWKSSEDPPPDFIVKALLACFVRLSNPLEGGEVLPPHREDRLRRFDARNRPQFINWQRVYQDALSLFLLLRYSRQAASCPSRIFDEEIVLSLASRGHAIDREVPKFIRDRNLQKRYARLLQIIGL